MFSWVFMCFKVIHFNFHLPKGEDPGVPISLQAALGARANSGPGPGGGQGRGPRGGLIGPIRGQGGKGGNGEKWAPSTPPPRAPRALLGHFGTSPPGLLAILSKTCSIFRLFDRFLSKRVEKIAEIEGVGPIWRVPGRNSASNPAKDVQNGWMATHLVLQKCGLGSLGVPSPASTLLALGPSLRAPKPLFSLGFSGFLEVRDLHSRCKILPKT